MNMRMAARISLLNAQATEKGVFYMVKGKTAVKEPSLKKVFICSPFRPRGKTKEERERDWKRNIDVANKACRYAVDHGCVPYAPHLYFPQFLSEADPDEREMGILLGLTWLAGCDELWVIGDRISEGMKREISKADEWKIPVKHFIHKASVAERFIVVILGLDRI